MANTINKHFPVPLRLVEAGNGYFELEEDFVFVDPRTGTKHTAPKGFITNLYSTPWFVRWAISKILSANGPSVIHDFLYSVPMTYRERQEADRILLSAMKHHPYPVPKWKRWAIYRALRGFGRGGEGHR